MSSTKYKKFSNIHTQSAAAAECRRWSGIGAKACGLLVLFGSMGAGVVRCLLVKLGIGASAGAAVWCFLVNSGIGAGVCA